MAIVRYTHPNTTKLQSFKEFLEANKEGTFLENVDFILDSQESEAAVHRISFVPEGSVSEEDAFFFLVTAGVSASFSYVYALGENAANDRIARTEYDGYSILKSAVLCKKGLLMVWNVNARATRDVYLFLTVDSDGDFAVVRPAGSTDDSVAYGENASKNIAVSENSTFISTFGAAPQFNANLTSFSSIPVIGIDNELYLPYAYAASSVQLPRREPNAITIDGENYITDGIIYIKDKA